MDSKVKKEWVAALRSKRFKQGEGALKKEDMYSGEIYHCCLGVLCEIAIESGLDIPVSTWENGDTEFEFGVERATSFLPNEVMVWAGLSLDNPNVSSPLDDSRRVTVASLNDDHYSFVEIADRIEKDL